MYTIHNTELVTPDAVPTPVSEDEREIVRERFFYDIVYFDVHPQNGISSSS